MQGEERNRRQGDRWHVVKGIPVTVLLFLAAQTGSFIWSMSALSNTVTTQASELAAMKSDIRELVRALNSLAAPLAVNATEVQVLKARLEVLTAQVDRMQQERLKERPR